VAGQPSDDRPWDSSTNRAIDGSQESSAPGSEALGDDQTLADRDQTLAEADQTGSDGDQSVSDDDQAAADCDQEASDRDLVHGGDSDTHDITRDIRDRSAQKRQHGAQQRVDTGADRDAVAQARDRTAAARDKAAALRDRQLSALARAEAAALRDRELASREAAVGDDGRAATSAEIVARAEEVRRAAAADRAAAVEGRARAALAREQAALDREQAARDRLRARAEREALRHQLAIAETDALTGARTRAPGLADLDHEIARARRTMEPLAVAYVDIVGLKAENDTHGHGAGDALLRCAVHAIRGHLRSYDVIVRVGGDEFLCVMSGATIEDARQRFDAVHAALAAEPDPCEIKVGFAALAPLDSAAELIERADADLSKPATWGSAGRFPNRGGRAGVRGARGSATRQRRG
jgi:diguanylate cyclase (GGDEF)-like protein